TGGVSGFETFGLGDLVKVDCVVRHVALLTPEVPLRVRLSCAAKVLDLKERFRSRGYGGRSELSFSIRSRERAAPVLLTPVPPAAPWPPSDRRCRTPR